MSLSGGAGLSRCHDNRRGEDAMGKVLLEFNMSLDGYVASPDVSPEAPMGRGARCCGTRLFGEGSSPTVRLRPHRPTRVR